MTLAAAPQTIAGYYDSVGGKVQTGTRMIFGHNTGRKGYGTFAFPFIDVFKTAGLWYNWAQAEALGATMDSNGYVDMTGLGAGTKIAALTHAGYIQTGTWVLTWDTADSTECNWTGGTETPDSVNNVGGIYWPTVGRREFTVSVTNPSNFEIEYRNGLCTNIKLFLKSEEARQTAGNIINSTYVSDVAGIQVMRVMPNQATYSTGIQNPVDFTPYTYRKWGQGTPLTDDVPIRTIGQMCNEIDCDVWLSVPHQATDACIDFLATELDTYLDNTRMVYVEWSNETWNSIFPQLNYSRYLDAPDHNSTVVPATATATEVNHGLVTGDLMQCVFNNVHRDFPYSTGQMYVIRDTDDVYRFANTAGAATRGADVMDSGDPDYNVNNEPTDIMTAVRYKLISDSADQAPINRVDRAIQCWERFTTVFGASRVKRVLGGQSNSPTIISQQLNVPGAREGADYISIAPYAWFDQQSGFENWTFAEMTDFLIDTFLPNNVGPQIAAHVALTGTSNIVCYEAGDHNSHSINPAQDAAVLGWARSTEATRFYTYYYEYMASQGVVVCCNFDDHRVYSTTGDGTWGVMEHIGQTDATKYLGIKDFLDAGIGVPKL